LEVPFTPDFIQASATCPILLSHIYVACTDVSPTFPDIYSLPVFCVVFRPVSHHNHSSTFLSHSCLSNCASPFSYGICSSEPTDVPTFPIFFAVSFIIYCFILYYLLLYSLYIITTFSIIFWCTLIFIVLLAWGVVSFCCIIPYRRFWSLSHYWKYVFYDLPFYLWTHNI